MEKINLSDLTEPEIYGSEIDDNFNWKDGLNNSNIKNSAFLNLKKKVDIARSVYTYGHQLIRDKQISYAYEFYRLMVYLHKFFSPSEFIARIYWDLGICCETLKKNEEAENYYELAIKYWKTIPNGLKRHVYMRLAYTQYYLKKWDESLRSFQRAKNLFGQAGDIYKVALCNYSIACILVKGKHFQQALTLLQGVLIENPELRKEALKDPELTPIRSALLRKNIKMN